MLLKTINDVTKIVKEWKKEGKTIGVVPTMGALHSGHASLIKKAHEICDKVIVSVFLNPIQFGVNEYLDKYPRTLENDVKVAKENGADVVFAPCISEMYPVNQKATDKNFTYIYAPYMLSDKLCGKVRPGHFDGVLTVVNKLFNISQADFAFFGQKDAQQLIIVKKMVKDLNIPIEIVPCPIVRDIDGLALSSRNSYLTKEQRKQALCLNKMMKTIERLFSQGVITSRTLFDEALTLLDKNIELEYLEFVDFEQLENVEEIKSKTLVAAAIHVGKVRLIDNVILNP